MVRGIRKGGEILEVLVFPAGGEQFRPSAAGLVEAAVTDFIPVLENQAPGGVYRLSDILAYGHGEALIPLAVVIGTDIEVPVVIVVEPLYILFGALLKGIFPLGGVGTFSALEGGHK